MNSYILEELATDSNFDESAYLMANPDVAQAVKSGKIKSGLIHFNTYGKNENRKLRHPLPTKIKKNKLEKVKSLLRSDMQYQESESCYDFLTTESRLRFDIVDTGPASSLGYDQYTMDIINKYKNGLILDCGAGWRGVYFDNVVNLEISPYDTTDVVGAGEMLPFIDNSFDAVLSLSVLEHVKDPFLCAREIARVLKPGGELMCCAPFLVPFHGNPHHYYNMTHQGLRNLFEDSLKIDRIDVYHSVLPIWSLIWIIRSWSDGLKGKAKEEFLNLKISDLMETGDKYLDKAFVSELSIDKNHELAAGNVLFAHKEK